MEFYNVTGVTYNKDNGYAALLVGNTENNTTNKYSNKVNGYNLLAKNCKFGYNNQSKDRRVIDCKYPNNKYVRFLDW